MPFAPYDARFTRVFKAELAKRRCPFYPEPRWMDALRVADLQAPCSSPPRQLAPLLMSTKTQTPEYQREKWDADDVRLRESLDFAIAKWWRRHGLV